MKKSKIIKGIAEELPIAVLEDFSRFEEKMAKVRDLKGVYQNLDKTFIVASIDELGLNGKRISAGKLKKVFKKVITKMIEEVEK